MSVAERLVSWFGANPADPDALPVRTSMGRVSTSTPVRPKPMTQDQLLSLFSAASVGRNVVLEPATQFDMCGKKEIVKETLEVIYDEV